MPMPLPEGCPPFEYSTRIDAPSLLAERQAEFLISLLSATQTGLLAAAKDTRAAHKDFFRGLTPSDHDYYAGNYRGDDRFRCLKKYCVYVPGDPRVGADPAAVSLEMRNLINKIDKYSERLDEQFREHQIDNDGPRALLALINETAALFVEFLRIHPYANGNGHMARLVLTVLLYRKGIRLRTFNMEPRPADPPYTQAIIDYRNGNPKPLVHFVLTCL